MELLVTLAVSFPLERTVATAALEWDSRGRMAVI